MFVLGFNGGTNLVNEDFFDLDATNSHDSAAVILQDGVVVAGIEQERLDRIKHSNKFPIDAIRFCLADRGVRPQDVDAFVYYTTEETMRYRVRQNCLKRYFEKYPTPSGPLFKDPREFFTHRLSTALDHPVPSDRIHFVRHHVAHLVSAFACSGLERSLVLSIDGVGEGESGRVAIANDTTIATIQRFPAGVSLGHFYTAAIRYIGFGMFDEYKAMGLAPYGDPAHFRTLFKQSYALLPSGEYRTNTNKLFELFDVMLPRKKGEPFTQEHMDLAAAVQEALEAIVFHILRHHRKATGENNLCLAGGVAHNCTLNGRLAASGMFDNVFVQPAAHDAGCALGAALSVYYTHADAGGRAATPARNPPLRARTRGVLNHVYWGTDLGSQSAIKSGLERWHAFVEFEEVETIEKRTAELLAAGSVVGWVQGRSEFGPRALGNRSILADPRPADNKRIINAMVKKREGFRPFAPSVLEEDASDYFGLEGMKNSPFMIFVVDVHPGKRPVLGAVTHVDGSARVQTVSRSTNPRYWTLISEFKAITGVPVILNTSFNNHAEPIVDSVEDAVVCFLTTNLHHLVVGNYLVSRRQTPLSVYRTLVPRLPRQLHLSEVERRGTEGFITERSILSNTDSRFRQPLSADGLAALRQADGTATLGDIMTAAGIDDIERSEALVSEICELWSSRAVSLTPQT